MKKNKLYKERDWLKNQYITNGLSASEISKICDVNSSTICDWLRRHKIPIRSPKEATENCYIRFPEVKEKICASVKIFHDNMSKEKYMMFGAANCLKIVFGLMLHKN